VGPITADTIDLGNVLKNSNNFQLNGQMNLTNLYNKIGYLKEVNDKFRNGFRQPSEETRTKEVTYTQEGITLRAGRTRSINHKLKTEEVTATFYSENGQEIAGELVIASENRITFTTEQDYRRVRVEVVGTIERGENPLVIIADYTSRLLMSVRNISVTYNQSNGSMLPGYKPSTTIMGMQNYRGSLAPGWPFILGWQDEDFPDHAAQKGWLSKDPMINSPFSMNHSNTFNIRSTVEPLPGLRIDLTANRNYSESMNAYYIAGSDGQFPDSTRSRQITGNFTMSYLTIGTAFEKVYSDDNFASETFDRFKDEYRFLISERLAIERAKGGDYPLEINDTTGFYEGYGPGAQAVVIPAFLAAYSGRDIKRISLAVIPGLMEMRPNWRITFDGLSRIDFIRQYFRSINLNHSYRSSYNVGSFISNPFYEVTEDGFVDLEARDMNGNFLNENDIASVSISEQFSPLISFDMNWVNSLTTRLELKKSRSLALSLANNQLTEISSNEVVVGAGYRFSELPLIFNLPGGGQTAMTSDLNVRADFSIRDNRTIIRKLEEDVDQITAGQRVLKINLNFDYVLSDRFNLRLFFDRIINKPFVSLSYPTANTNIGFSVRFTLAQ
jgi:cell surface protein SprA